MQQHDQPMLLGQLLQGLVQGPDAFELLLVELEIVSAGKTRKTVTGHLAFLDHEQSSPREAAFLVDKQVVHDAAQPGTRFVDVDEIVEFAVSLYKEFLEQVFGLILGTGKPPRETIQPVKVRSYERLERLARVAYGSVPFLANT